MGTTFDEDQGTELRYYTADGRLTSADAVDCVIQRSVQDALRLGLPVTPEAPAPLAKHIPAPPEDKMVRSRRTKKGG